MPLIPTCWCYGNEEYLKTWLIDEKCTIKFSQIQQCLENHEEKGKNLQDVLQIVLLLCNTVKNPVGYLNHRFLMLNKINIYILTAVHTETSLSLSLTLVPCIIDCFIAAPGVTVL